MSMVHICTPLADDLAGWVRLLDDAYWFSTDEMIHLHSKLHEAFGTEPSDAVLEGERKLSGSLRSLGIEHRYTDALSKAAGTLVETPALETLEEVQWYLRDVQMHSGAVKLVQGVDSPAPIFAIIDESMLPKGSAKSILRQINKMMPPGVVIKMLPKKPKEDFLREIRAFDLALSSVKYPEVIVVPWKQIVAEAPTLLLKADKEGNKSIEMQVTVAKFDTRVDEYGRPVRFILGPVLIPEEEDTQKEIYSHEEVEKACHWFAEHSQNLSLTHVLQGGTALDSSEMVPVENYCMPVDCEIAGVHIKSGTWMLGANAYGTEICDRIDAGEVKTWSIGADALSWIEEVENAV